MNWDEGIEGPHLGIAGSTAPRLGVLAGPGTGKTSFGLMRRVLRLLQEGVPGDRILLLSFTRVAAADLRDKVARLEAPNADSVRATTLHAYCFGVLQKDAVLYVTGRVPRILLDHESDLMLRDLGGDFGNIRERRRRLEAFAAGWARVHDDHPGPPQSDVDRDFGIAVLAWLRDHKAMLIGEVVPQVYAYLSTNPAAEEHGAFDHVVVDEYQDLNALEQRLLELLSEGGALCVAGDEDQSIYSVRYANPEGILEYMARADVESFEITVCGRCPENILAMANSLIAQAPARSKPQLEPRDATGEGLASIVQWETVEAEIDGIVAAIAQDVGSRRREPGDILVLTNWRRIGEAIRARLNELEIPTRSFFTEEELGSAVGQEALATLRLVADPDDASALRVLLGLGDQSHRTDAYQRLLATARASGMTPARVLDRMVKGDRFDIRVPSLVDIYRDLVGRVERLVGMNLADVVSEIFPDSVPELADLRAVAIAALDSAQSVADLLRSVVETITQDEVPQNPDFVRVMSLHKSKGLTSPSVYLVGAVHGVLPTVRDREGAELDAAMAEGRRLMYVALTRAAEELTVSSALLADLADASARGVRFDPETIRRDGDRHTVRLLASPFLAELGPSAPRPTVGGVWLASR